MSHNPYQPPEASIDDPVVPTIARPPEVTRACRILWIFFVIGLVALLPVIRGEWWQLPEHGESSMEGAKTVILIISILLGALLVALYSLLIWLLGRRHNWARWALLTFLIFSWYSSTTSLPQTFSEAPLAGVIDLLSIPAEIWATCLLFFGPGGRWFKASNES